MHADSVEYPSHWSEIVSNIKIYDLEECVRASGYPMEAEIIPRPTTEQDYKRAAALAKNPPGTGHNNFLKGIRVAFDLTFTKQGWSEAERYSYFDLISSGSTIHSISRMNFDKIYLGYVDPRMIEIVKNLRETYEKTGDPEDYLRLIYSSPAGLKLTCRIDTNYSQLKTIYIQRKNHKLPEWRRFCEWIETLPHSDWITENDKCM